MDKHFADEELINRIYDKYHRLSVDSTSEIKGYITDDYIIKKDFK